MEDDYSALQERLGTLPDKLSYSIMVGGTPAPVSVGTPPLEGIGCLTSGSGTGCQAEAAPQGWSGSPPPTARGSSGRSLPLLSRLTRTGP